MTASTERVREEIAALLPRLRRFARALARNVDDADDLVQISIERALQRIDQWRTESKLESWMFGIIRNAWIDEARSKARRGRVFLPEEAGEHVGEALIETHIQVTSIQEALALLPEEQRIVIALVLIEGLSYQEAADVIGAPMGTVTSRLARGREALQRLLNPPAEKGT